ncbi:MAG: SUMF1/EgtB/PvdO family nonheme iron enzyme, partial [Bacteroidota bacterium]
YDAQGKRRQIWAGTSNEDSLSYYAWYGGNSDGVQAVGGKEKNLLGLYDMSGNVDEWCADRYGAYPTSELSNPRGPDTGDNRVIRGGYWFFTARYCRVSNRNNVSPGYQYFNLGFRVAFSPQF